MINFVYYLCFFGILFASLQDLKKREVDNYLNFFLLTAGAVFILIYSAYEWNYWILLSGLVCFLVMFVLGNLFYYGRVFAGGDAKLLIAIFFLFISFSIKESLINMGFFILILLFAGGLWGLFYSIFLIFRNLGVVKKNIGKEIKNKYFVLVFVLGVVSILLGIFNYAYFVFGVLCFVGIVLFLFGKVIDKHVMIKEISSRNAREGDWLMDKIKIKGRWIKPNWEGLSKKDVVLLKSINKKIKIKDGIPFVPAFLVAFIVYLFKEQIIGWVFSII